MMLFFAGGRLHLKPDSSSDMLWNEFALAWTEIPGHESKAIDLDSTVEAKEMKVADDNNLLVSDFCV